MEAQHAAEKEHHVKQVCVCACVRVCVRMRTYADVCGGAGAEHVKQVRLIH